eukprot:7760815-Heterocapsa_arctica.AAC.1
MALRTDWNAHGSGYAPLPAVGTLLRLDEVLVGPLTGISFARVSWPLRDHLDHPAGLLAASSATPANRAF